MLVGLPTPRHGSQAEPRDQEARGTDRPLLHADKRIPRRVGGVPRAGLWREIANTDSRFYGGSDMGNGGAVGTAAAPSHGEPQSLDLILPPLSTIMLAPEG